MAVETPAGWASDEAAGPSVQLPPDLSLDRILHRSAHTLVARCAGADGARVVVKTPAPWVPAPEAEARYRREHRLLTLAPGPHLVGAVELRFWGARPFLVLADAGAETLAHHLAWGPLRPDDVLHILVWRRARAPSPARRRCPAPRRCPANLLWALRTGAVELIDLDRALERETPAAAPELAGPPTYRAPELCGIAHAPADARADLYALGVTAWQLLVGHPPFDGADAEAVIHAHLARRATPVHRVRAEVPRALSDIVQCLLRKRPADRYPDAAALLADLEAAQRGGAAPGPAGRLTWGACTAARWRTTRWSTRSRRRARAGAAGGDRRRGRRRQEPAARRLPVSRRGWRRRLLRRALRRGGQRPTLRGRRRGPARGGRRVARRARRAGGGSPGGRPSGGGAQPRSRRRAGAGVRPTLESLPPPTAVDPVEARARARHVLCSVLYALASPERPLVLAIDDLHWADGASLDLLARVASDPQHRGLLVVVASRDARFLEMLSDRGVDCHAIRLAPLDEAALAGLIADTLACGRADAAPLAAVLERRPAATRFRQPVPRAAARAACSPGKASAGAGTCGPSRAPTWATTWRASSSGGWRRCRARRRRWWARPPASAGGPPWRCWRGWPTARPRC
ncbi:MAG: AAA family ATPase [Myxococcales bacterium]|nr:AAA family ATPase [Myxococcales bacterium]